MSSPLPAAGPAPPDECEILIDTPAWGFIKRRDDGEIDFISPLPCPFNYGSVPGTRGGDGDRLDALVLGRRLIRGARVRRRVVAVVHFIDAGETDTKWVCAERPLGPLARLQIEGFFHIYAVAKRAINRLRKRAGNTRFEGLQE